MPPFAANAGFPKTFTHLEVHSHYTLLGATASVNELVAAASGDGLNSLALTDTNVLYGAVSFDRACLAAGIRPILGMVVDKVYPQQDAFTSTPSVPETSRFTLLAMGRTGYRSLCRLSSHIQTQPPQGSGTFPGITWSDLKENTEGLLCLSGGGSDLLYKLIQREDRLAASQYIAHLGGLFGENAFLAIELSDDGDDAIAREIYLLGQRFGLQTVAVQPVYYLETGSAPRIKLLQAIARNCPVEEVTEDYSGLHWRSPAEMAARFADFPDSLRNIEQIISRCQRALPDGRPIWPKLNLPKGQTPETRLATVAQEGLIKKYGSAVPDPIRKRLQSELNAIDRSGYSPLFLIVADIALYARENEIMTSTRGSVANSLVAYCVGITTVDPIANDLLFERFLNPARANPPDIDLDFCSRRRDEVLEYVRRTYGKEQVALVATVSTLRDKSAIRETAKAFGLSENEIGFLANKLPRRYHSNPYRRIRGKVSDLVEELEDTRFQRIALAAADLLRQPHHLSIHPGGVVITPGPLTDHVPVQWSPKGFLITQFNHKDIEALGLPKLDLLGIRALTVLADSVDLVRAFHDPNFQLDHIPLEDPKTANILEQGETIGVFQCESAGAQRTLRQLRVHNIPDLAVANAFFKPGPATGGMAQSFIRRYRGEEKVQYLHPALKPILSSTHGVLLFQEQILRLATEIAGLSWEQADHLRRGMTKFKPEEMAALQSDFVNGCTEIAPDGPGLSDEQAETLWGQVLAFAGYGFNRGHATAYANVSYRSAYLKAHWPEIFLCARLAGWGGFHHPAIYIAEAIRLGFNVRPPHINHSNRRFNLSYGKANSTDKSSGDNDRSPTLWMGLGQVRHLRQNTIGTIVDQRKSGPFSSLVDFIQRVSLQQKELFNLIQCGALDGLGSNRSALLTRAETAFRSGGTSQMTFDFADRDSYPESATDCLKWEKSILGQSISVHPLDLLAKQPAGITPLDNLIDDIDSVNRHTSIIGVRLPGWTGGPGFFLGDQKNFITVRNDKDSVAPEAWVPLLIRGRWRTDRWGTGWFQAESIKKLQ